MNGLAQAARGYSGDSSPDVVRSVGASLIGETTSDAAELAQRIYTVGNIVREFADGMFGSQPETAGSGLKEPEPIGRASILRAEVRSLKDATDRLEAQVARLHAI